VARGLVSLAAPLLAMGVASQAGGSAADTAVRYVANAGMLVTVDGHDLLIDAPIRQGIPPYPTSAPEDRRRLESAEPPYDRVEAILITHWHEDHFSAEAIAAHLSANPRATVISSPEVIDRIRVVAPRLESARLRGCLPAAGQADVTRIGDLTVRILRIRHNTTRRLPEQHVGFLVGDARTVLHVGDADPAADNFALLTTLPRVDIALLPYWYVLTDDSRRFVAASIAPRRIVAMHLPVAETDTLTAALRNAALRVSLPGMAGHVVDLTR
jgi:L-ascorbate metabolism protein UlaG (beta-lactamase superfamily)